MTKTIRLNDLQLVLLAGAARRDSGSLIPLPESCRQDTTAIDKAIASLLRRGLVEEVAVTDRKLAWRQDDEVMTGLFITQAGRDAIGAGAPDPADNAAPAKPAAQLPPPPTSKIATVLSLMRRNEGATLEEMVAATAWQPHTTRAALTGLRKKGHALASEKIGDVRRYRIVADAGASA